VESRISLGASAGTLWSAKEVAMTEEKPESNGVLKRNAHRCALCGQAVAVLSILFLVPFLRRRREQRKARCHGRFAILGH
jgi:hypothetical protein